MMYYTGWLFSQAWYIPNLHHATSCPWTIKLMSVRRWPHQNKSKGEHNVPRTFNVNLSENFSKETQAELSQVY